MNTQLRTVVCSFALIVTGLVGGHFVFAQTPATPAPAVATPAPQVIGSYVPLGGWEIPVRGVGELSVTPKTHRVSVEVFRDVNRNNLIYVSDTGSIAVLPVR